MTILEKIKFEEDWLSEVNLTKENVKIALGGIRATALEAQPCEDCISRETVHDLINTWLNDYLSEETREALETISGKVEDLPSVQIQPCEDAVSREAVYDAINDSTETSECGSCIDEDKFLNLLRALPSVQPTNEDMREAYIKGYDYGVKDWFKSKIQPCEDAVNREAVIRLVEQYPSIIGNRCSGLIADIKHLPSVTPQRPKGEWIYKTRIKGNPYIYECSVCNECHRDKFKYCPNCGAEMRRGEEDGVSN